MNVSTAVNSVYSLLIWLTDSLGMTYKALSDRIKKHKGSKAKEARLKEAAKAYRDAQNGTEKVSFRNIADKFPGVGKSTLECYIKGKGKTILEFNATKQKLSPNEENVLINLILESSSCGFPFKHREI